MHRGGDCGLMSSLSGLWSREALVNNNISRGLFVVKIHHLHLYGFSHILNSLYLLLAVSFGFTFFRWSCEGLVEGILARIHLAFRGVVPI